MYNRDCYPLSYYAESTFREGYMATKKQAKSAIKPQAKLSVGRPSKYNPDFCQRVIQLGKLGKSIEQMACELDVSTRTMFEWRDVHPEFSHAMEQAKEYEQNWWETVAQTHMIEEQGAAKLNASIWSRSMAARFPKKYRESTKHELTGADGAPLEFTKIERVIVKNG